MFPAHSARPALPAQVASATTSKLVPVSTRLHLTEKEYWHWSGNATLMASLPTSRSSGAMRKAPPTKRTIWRITVMPGSATSATMKHGLNMHLNSPKHKEKVYHCPNRRGGCAKQFVSLAGLFNHLESETCSFMRFDKVQQHASMILDGRRFITF